jgi:hypothetical protein
MTARAPVVNALPIEALTLSRETIRSLTHEEPGGGERRRPTDGCSHGHHCTRKEAS